MALVLGAPDDEFAGDEGVILVEDVVREILFDQPFGVDELDAAARWFEGESAAGMLVADDESVGETSAAFVFLLLSVDLLSAIVSVATLYAVGSILPGLRLLLDDGEVEMTHLSNPDSGLKWELSHLDLALYTLQLDHHHLWVIRFCSLQAKMY